MLNLYSRLCLYAMMALAICHPTLQIAAANTLSSQPPLQTPSEVNIFQGSLENGLSFVVIPSTLLKEGSWIKLNCKLPSKEENLNLPLLTQHAAFYGTSDYTREELAEQLDSLGLDVDADSYVHVNENEGSLQFCLSSQEPKKIRQLLQMTHQMTFFPNLKDEEVELARSHLLSNLKQKENELPLQSVTADELRKFHGESYSPENMQLMLLGISHSKETVGLISEIFASPITSLEEIRIDEAMDLNRLNAKKSFLSFFMERVEWSNDQHTYIVDGKIWMKEPNWINNSSNGKTLGTLLTILGIGGMVLTCPVLIPVAILSGGMAATGVYFLMADYLKDPYYVEKIRQTDLRNGCAYAYQKHHAGITLTPYERRALFLKEIVEHPQTLPKLPILLLADLYELNDPVVAQMFMPEELNLLTRIKRDFIQQRNQFKMLRESLEQELLALTTPYTLARNSALLHAKDIYNQNYYVVAKQNLKKAKEASLAEVEQGYRDNKISLKERDEMVAQANSYYEECLSEPTFKTGLELAESNLSKMELEAQATYTYHVELCKQSIQYYQRKDQIKLGENSLINYFNQELINQLSIYPVYMDTLPDYLDLRGL